MKIYNQIKRALFLLFFAGGTLFTVHAQEALMAEIRLFGGDFAPRNWAFCNGQILQIAQNQALFALLGTQYGGNGTTNFALPNLNGAVPVGTGSAAGLSPVTIAQPFGVDQVTLDISQLPAHTHTVTVNSNCSNLAANADTPKSNYFSVVPAQGNEFSTTSDAQMAAPQVIVGVAGGSQPHENRQPYIKMNYIICLYGIFPSRN